MTDARPLVDLSDFQPAELSDFGPALTRGKGRNGPPRPQGGEGVSGAWPRGVSMGGNPPRFPDSFPNRRVDRRPLQIPAEFR